MTTRSDTAYTGLRDVLRIRAFAAFWVGVVASNVGTWIHRTVAMVLVWEQTESPVAIGVLAAAATIPVLVFSLPAGYVSDRFDRRRTIIGAHLVSSFSALLLALYVAVGGRSAVAPIAVAFVLASMWAFAKPAMSAYFPSLIPREALRAATAANSFSFIVGQIVGPVIGAAFVAAGELTLAFAVNAGTFLVPAVIVSRLPASRVTRTGGGPDTGVHSYRAALSRANLALLAIIAMAAGANDVLRNLAPVVVAAVGASQEYTGILVTCVSIGSAIGVLTSGTVARALGEGRASAAGLVVQALSLILVTLSLDERMILVAAVGTGTGFSWTFVLMTTALQARTRDALRGRVMALHSLAHLGVRPATTLATSLVAASYGVAMALVGNGLVALATVLLIGSSRIGTVLPDDRPEPAEGVAEA